MNGDAHRSHLRSSVFCWGYHHNSPSPTTTHVTFTDSYYAHVLGPRKRPARRWPEVQPLDPLEKATAR
jgi:hypothetical protein